MQRVRRTFVARDVSGAEYRIKRLADHPIRAARRDFTGIPAAKVLTVAADPDQRGVEGGCGRGSNLFEPVVGIGDFRGMRALCDPPVDRGHRLRRKTGHQR
jgi:hypothetical protein